MSNDSIKGLFSFSSELQDAKKKKKPKKKGEKSKRK
jgi:hypothetical protein